MMGRSAAAGTEPPAAERDQARAAYLVRRHVLESVGAALAGAGLEALLVKGAALAETVYREPWTRPMSDIDLVVHARDLGPALGSLERAGAIVAPVPADRRWSHARMGERVLELPVGPIGWTVELHTEIDRIAPRPIPWSEVWTRSTYLEDFSGALRVPCREDHALLVILHASLSDFAHPPAASDLTALWRAGIDEAAFADRAEAWRLTVASYLALAPRTSRGFAGASPELVLRLCPPRWRLDLAARAIAAGRELGWRWTLRQASFRDDPANWLGGLARYGAVRAAERLLLAGARGDRV